MSVDRNGVAKYDYPEQINTFVGLINQIHQGELTVELLKAFSSSAEIAILPESAIIIDEDGARNQYMDSYEVKIDEVTDGGKHITLVPNNGNNQFINYVPENINHGLMITLIQDVPQGHKITHYKGDENVPNLIEKLNQDLEAILSAQQISQKEEA